MTVAPLAYLFPALLGYLLFVGISGRVGPLPLPARPADLPSWLLGAWSGLALTLVLLAGLVAFHGQPPGGARALLAPSGWALAMLMLPGLALWHVCRGRVAGEDDVHLPAEEGDTSTPTESVAGERAGQGRRGEADELSALARENTPPVATFLSRVAPGPVEVPNIPVAPSELAVPGERRGSGHAAGAVERVGSSVPFARRNDRADGSGRSDKERVDVLISLEAELENRIREGVATEAALDRETARCAELERKLAKLNRDTLSARHAARRGDRARARAVGAATRSLTLARQAIRTRALAEERLRESEEMLAARQATIGSLVSALEQARNRSRSAAPETASGATDPRATGRAARETSVAAAAVAGSLPAFTAEDKVDAPAMAADGRPGARLARKAARVRPPTSRG